MDECFGSTCHGAGRAQSRNKSRRALSYQDVLGKLAEQGIAIRVASPKLVRTTSDTDYSTFLTHLINSYQSELPRPINAHFINITQLTHPIVVHPNPSSSLSPIVR